MSTHSPTIDDFGRWVLAGAQWRVVDISDHHAIVDMCACTGEAVDRVETDDPVVIDYLRTAHLDLGRS